MQTDMILSSPDIHRHGIDPDQHSDQPIETITSEFNSNLHLEPNDCVDNKEDDDEEEDNEEDDDFTFKFDDLSIDGDVVLEHGQTGQMFPLFDRKLLQEHGDYDVEGMDRLPIEPPVDKIFIPSPRRFPPSTDGPYHAWSKSTTGTATGAAELSKKSNSTGFSKLWRLKEKVGRSNSYGRDAFVFLKISTSKPAAADGGGFVKVNGGRKAKEGRVSAHEAYLKSRGGEEEGRRRRRSYLPYRPELMGFFTNVQGGLTKNVHPY